MFFVNTYRWDYLQLPALVAPRPLLISNTDKDSIFPLDGVMRIYLKTMKIYDLYNARNKLGLHICEGPHKDTQQLRIHAFVWFNRFLKDDTSLISKPAEPFFEPEQLKVFDKLPTDEINTTIHESFVPKAPPPVVPKSAEEWKQQRDSWTKTLREKVFRGWPSQSEAGPLDVKETFSARRYGIDLKAFDFTSQPNVRLRLYVFRPAKVEKVEGLSLKILDTVEAQKWLADIRIAFLGRPPGDDPMTQAEMDAFQKEFKPTAAEMRRSLAKKKAILAVMAPRGLGLDAWNDDERKQTQIRRRFMLLGQTLDGMRVWDARRAIQALRAIDSLKEIPLTLEGRGTIAGIALYAALFEPNIQALRLWDTPHSHRQGPIFLSVLRYLDIPQAMAMAAEHAEIQVHQDDNFEWQFPKDVARKLAWPEKQFECVFGKREDP